MAYGLYRKKDGWGDQHSVRVKYTSGPEDEFGPELEVPEKFYAEEGWQPPFDQLQWEHELAGADPASKANGAGDGKNTAA